LYAAIVLIHNHTCKAIRDTIRVGLRRVTKLTTSHHYLVLTISQC